MGDTTAMATSDLAMATVKPAPSLRVECIGSHHEQGRRATMEDTSTYMTRDGWTVAGVFDGHGGKRVADQLADEKTGIAAFLIEHSIQVFSIADVSEVKYSQLLTQWCLEYDNHHFQDYMSEGSTASIVIVPPVSRIVYLVNIGDSRTTILQPSSNLYTSTTDDKPSSQSEMERIVKSGGHVTFHNVARVNGILSVSRAFGDFGLKRTATRKTGNQPSYKFDNNNAPVIARPRVKGVKLTRDSWIVIACDGLWDVTKESDLMTDVQTNQDNAAQLSTMLKSWTRRAVHDRSSNDNVSVMLLRAQAM